MAPIETVLGERDDLHARLKSDGMLLLRGYEPADPIRMRATAEALTKCFSLPNHEARTGREVLAQGVYTTTSHPAAERITLHSEKAHTNFIPRYLALLCQTAATSRGGTSLAPSTAIDHRLPSKLREKFRTSPIIYSRVYSDVGGENSPFGIFRAFGTTVEKEISQYLDERSIDFHWTSKRTLHTSWKSAAYVTVADAPNEVRWANAVLHYDPRSYIGMTKDGLRKARLLRAVMPDGRLPFDISFDDGSWISDEDISLLINLHLRETQELRWQVGDLLIIDNLSFLHGREPYSGDRLIQFMMLGGTVRATPVLTGISTLSEIAVQGINALGGGP